MPSYPNPAKTAVVLATMTVLLAIGVGADVTLTLLGSGSSPARAGISGGAILGGFIGAGALVSGALMSRTPERIDIEVSSVRAHGLGPSGRVEEFWFDEIATATPFLGVVAAVRSHKRYWLITRENLGRIRNAFESRERSPESR